MKTKLIVLSVVAALLLGLVACAPPTPEVIEKEVVVEKEVPVTVEVEKEVVVEVVVTATPTGPTQGGTLTYAIWGSIDSIMPQHYHTGHSRDMFEFLFDSLLIWTPEGELGPRLADKWTVNEDGTVFTFHIRDDANWTDGVPVSAEDMAWSIEIMAHPDYAGIDYSFVAPIKGAEERRKDGPGAAELGVKVIDLKTIEITTEKPFLGLLATLGIELRPMPKHVLKDIPIAELIACDFRFNPVPSNGPFKFKEYMQDDHATFVANEDYYLGRPYLDEIVMRFTNPVEWAAGLEAHELDMVANLPGVDVDRVKQLPYLEIQTWPAAHIQYISFNWDKPEIFSKEVRQALCYAIDKKSIAEGVMLGFADLSAGIMNQFYPGYCPQHDYAYDAAKAKKMLGDAGFDFGQELQLMYTAGGVTDQVVAAFQANWLDIGVNVKLLGRDTSQNVATAQKDPENYWMCYWGFKNYMDPDAYMTRRYYTGEPANLSRYSKDDIDAMILEARHEGNPEKRAQQYCELQRIITEDCTNCPLFVGLSPAVVHKRVHGVQFRMFGTRDNSYEWWVEPVENFQ